MTKYRDFYAAPVEKKDIFLKSLQIFDLNDFQFLIATIDRLHKHGMQTGVNTKST